MVVSRLLILFCVACTGAFALRRAPSNIHNRNISNAVPVALHSSANTLQNASSGFCVFGTDAFRDASVLWDAPKSSPIPHPGQVWLDPKVLRDMREAVDTPSRQVSAAAFSKPDGWRAFENDPLFVGASNRAVLMEAAAVDRDGRILERASCKQWRQGGCPIVGYSNQFVVSQKTPTYPAVITIAGMWGGAIWHFPMEGVSGLSNLNPVVLRDEKVSVHVTNIGDYALQWLDIVGVAKNRVITGEVAAGHLYVPEMGRCGIPSSAQLDWLKAHILAKIGPGEERKSLLVVKRANRGIANHEEVVGMLEKIAEMNGMVLELHDDTKLPSVLEQLKTFQRAAIVVAPHGAGELMMVASDPGTCIVEAQKSDDPKIGVDTFSKLALRLGHNFAGISMLGPLNLSPVYSYPVSLDDLVVGLGHCSGLSGKALRFPSFNNSAASKWR